MIAAGCVAACGMAGILLGGHSAAPELRQRFDLIGALQCYRHLRHMPTAQVLYLAVEGGLVLGCFAYFVAIQQARGLGGAAEAGLTVAAFGCGGLVYAAIAKVALRRFGQRRLVRLGGALCLLALMGFGFATSAWLFIAGGLMLGVNMYLIHNMIQTRVTELMPQARGSAVALHAFHFFVGQTLGPVLYGLTLSQLGGAIAFPIAGACLLGLSFLLGRPSNAH
ncbi:MAG: MFS transporter [Acetobacteraceae bacterium]|nr:MFS transporter [Acetobacteraceae bacterium]MSP28902.1 MFS transporter [Acetobacteraceae bacterium]